MPIINKTILMDGFIETIEKRLLFSIKIEN
jgi:hypothetical protein